MDKGYYKEMVEKAKLRPLDDSLTTNDKQEIECLLCNNVFEAAVKGKMTNFRKHGIPGCKECTSKQRYRDIREERYKELCEKFDIIDQVTVDDLNNLVMLRVRNKECGHAFKSKYGNLLNRDVTCPVCNTERKREQYREFNEERHKESLSTKRGFEQYKQLVYKLTRENYQKHKKAINPKNHSRVLSGNEGYHLDHIISVRNSFDLEVPAEICAHPKNLRMVEWKSNNKKWKRSSLNVPDVYLPYVENSVDTFVDEMREGCDWNEYEEFGKFMLTLYSEEKSFGVYYANLAMNSQQMLGSKKYLLELKEYFNSKNINVLVIFEDEWLTNKELVKKKIFHYMGQASVERIYARKCDVQEISNDVKNSFLRDNHIQGPCVSQVNIGLFYKKELVAVMTFGSPRVLMSNVRGSLNDENAYELTRFATKQETHIVGGASKLLKYFTRNYDWSNIFSYADRRWSVGNLYEVLGFELTRINPMNYHYVIDGKRKHRWGYRKDALKEKFPNKYDSELTEYQNMLNIGYDRIWDCGTLRYEMENR